MKTYRHFFLWLAWLVWALAIAPLSPLTASAQTASPPTTIGIVTITNVIVDTDSAKIDFAAVPGAVDYRVYSLADPTHVKYAGINFNAGGDPPMLEIQENGLTPGAPTQLVVEAVNQLGPSAEGSLYTDANAPAYPSVYIPGMSMLGSDEGATLDGLTSTNGQGPPTDNPQVIARSAPFTVTASGMAPIPSEADATQAFFDNFTRGTITPTGTPDPRGGDAEYTMVADHTWDIILHNDDIKDTTPFIAARHFMDNLFDGGTPGSGQPLHQGHGVLALSPQQTFDISGGRIAHITMEVDAHVDTRRWVAINIAPASDPLTNFDEGVADTLSPSGAVNNSNSAFFLQIFNDNYATNIYSKSSTGALANTAITGSLGHAPKWAPRGAPWGKLPNGIGLDNRSRFDLFISQSHFQVYENGVQVADADIPGGLPFSDLKVYFSHYVYHTDNEVAEVAKYAPYETFWKNVMKYSDERHWDNMGVEVLPASTAWTSTAALIDDASPVIAPPVVVPPPPPAPTGGTATGKIAAFADAAGTAAITVGGVSVTTSDTSMIGVASGALFAGAPVTITYDAKDVLQSISAAQ